VSSIPKVIDDEKHREGVSPCAAKQLRDAMDRLLAGSPQRTGGRLIKDNLWKEAGVSRATMNRAVRILAEWNCRVAECDGFTPCEARKNDEVATLRKKLEDKTRECTQLHHRRDAAATAIAALHHDNMLLRQELTAAVVFAVGVCRACEKCTLRKLGCRGAGKHSGILQLGWSSTPGPLGPKKCCHLTL
jgi:hypothetical protein